MQPSSARGRNPCGSLCSAGNSELKCRGDTVGLTANPWSSTSRLQASICHIAWKWQHAAQADEKQETFPRDCNERSESRMEPAISKIAREFLLIQKQSQHHEHLFISFGMKVAIGAYTHAFFISSSITPRCSFECFACCFFANTSIPTSTSALHREKHLQNVQQESRFKVIQGGLTKRSRRVRHSFNQFFVPQKVEKRWPRMRTLRWNMHSSRRHRFVRKLTLLPCLLAHKWDAYTIQSFAHLHSIPHADPPCLFNNAKMR